MDIRQSAKRGRFEAVRRYVESVETPPLDRLLQAATQDFHSIKKKPSHIDLVHYLLECGARANSEMVYQAARGGHGAIVSALLSTLDPVDIHTAAAAGQGQIVAKLLKTDSALCHQQDHEGKTPLHYCCASALARADDKASQNLLQVAQLLLEAGAPVDQPTPCGGLEAVTPLEHTCWTGGDSRIFEFLLAHGAQPTYQALWAAVGHFQRHGDGHYHLATRLLELGLDLNHNDDRTLLHSFAAHEDARGVAWLLDQGRPNQPAVGRRVNTAACGSTAQYRYQSRPIIGGSWCRSRCKKCRWLGANRFWRGLSAAPKS